MILKEQPVNLIETESDYIENLCFLDEYWEVIGTEHSRVNKARNKHFELLNSFLKNKIGNGISECALPCEYRPSGKRWDVNFPDKNIAIEYKSVTSKSIEKQKYMRIEEALGCAVDVKEANPNYKLGYIMVFAFTEENDRIIRSKNIILDAFDKMVKNGHYDFFCPLQTNGIGQHSEMMEEYSFDKFINGIL